MILRSKRPDHPLLKDDETEVRHPPGPLRQLVVPLTILNSSLRGLRGYQPYEGLCYWYGRELEQGVGLAMVVAFPRIYSTETSFQVMPRQMSQLTNWSADVALWLLAQAHTHPTDEPHSSADEEWSPTHREGFISIVFPFGAEFSNGRLPHWRVFECDPEGQWIDSSENKLHILDDVWLPAR